MKFPLHYYLLSAAALPLVSAWSSRSSSFAGSSSSRIRSTRPKKKFGKNAMVMYEPSNDPPNRGGNSGNSNIFSVLAHTEQWISETLAASTSPNQNNPYTRKEVSYVCEQQTDGAMIVSNIFRRLREAREQGESHGQAEEERREEVGDEQYSPRTLRQTQVIVIPSNEQFAESFATFDGLIEAINEARRNARDYVTDHSLEKLDEEMYGDDLERDWSVSVNCAHLHPKFGEKTANEILKEMQEEDEGAEVDVNLQAYKEKRMAARRSPYPTVVLEVRATPPPGFGGAPPSPLVQQPIAASDEKVSAEDIQKLEALFGKSAATTKERSPKEVENDFYDSIGSALGEISTVTPMMLAQNWIAEHDDEFDVFTSTFTTSDTKQVDEGYEFAFINLAMQSSRRQQQGASKQAKPLRQYLVMPNFLSSSATSLQKFANELTSITKHLTLPGKATVSTLHPEHVDETKRSPVPVLVWTWD